MTDNTTDARRKSLKNAIFAIPDEQLISRDIIIAAIDAALSQTPVAVDEREAFETWFIRSKVPNIHWAWAQLAWQSRATLPAKSEEEVRREVLEEVANLCEEIGERYAESNSRKYPELQDSAETGIRDCVYTIRSLSQAKEQG